MILLGSLIMFCIKSFASPNWITNSKVRSGIFLISSLEYRSRARQDGNTHSKVLGTLLISYQYWTHTIVTCAKGITFSPKKSPLGELTGTSSALTLAPALGFATKGPSFPK